MFLLFINSVKTSWNFIKPSNISINPLTPAPHNRMGVSATRKRTRYFAIPIKVGAIPVKV